MEEWKDISDTESWNGLWSLIFIRSADSWYLFYNGEVIEVFPAENSLDKIKEDSLPIMAIHTH